MRVCDVCKDKRRGVVATIQIVTHTTTRPDINEDIDLCSYCWAKFRDCGCLENET